MTTPIQHYPYMRHRGQWATTAFYPEGHQPTHPPPHEATEGTVWVWVPNDLYDTDGQDLYDRWGLCTTESADAGTYQVYELPTYTVASPEPAEPTLASAAQETIAGIPRKLVWIGAAAMLIGVLMIVIALSFPNLSFAPSAAAAQNPPQALSTPTALLPVEPPPMDLTVPEDELGQDEVQLPPECQDDAVQWVPIEITTDPASPTVKRVKIDSGQSWIPTPGTTYCIEHPKIVFRMFTQDSTLEMLKDWDIANDSSFNQGGSLLRRAATMWASRFRMSVKSSNQNWYLLRWNQAYYETWVKWMANYEATGGKDPSVYTITMPSTAPEEIAADRERLLKNEPLPLPPTAAPTAFQAPTITNTPPPPTITATLLPTLVMETVPTLKPHATATAPNPNSSYPGGGDIYETYPTEHPNYDYTNGATFLQTDCVQVFGTTSWSNLASLNFTEMTFRVEDDGLMHGYSEQVSWQDRRYLICVLDITGMPNPANVDGKGSVWGNYHYDVYNNLVLSPGTARKSPLYGTGDGTWNGNELRLSNGLWGMPITIGSGYSNPTPVPLPTSTKIAAQSLESFISWASTTNLYDFNSCGALPTDSTVVALSHSNCMDSPWLVDFGAVWSQLDTSKGIVFVVRNSFKYMEDDYQMAQWGSSSWYFGAVK